MTENLLRKKYFIWMCQIVDTNRKINVGSYRSLLEELNNIDFYAILPMDENRADDGIELRYQFGRDCGYPASMIASMLDVTPCSVLEMMVALALRGEHHVAEDTIYGGAGPGNRIYDLGQLSRLGVPGRGGEPGGGKHLGAGCPGHSLPSGRGRAGPVQYMDRRGRKMAVCG